MLSRIPPSGESQAQSINTNAAAAELFQMARHREKTGTPSSRFNGRSGHSQLLGAVSKFNFGRHSSPRHKTLFVAIFFMALTLLIQPALATADEPDCILNSSEQIIAAMMANNESQNRLQLVCHPILHRVARERAQDMADRNYFYHTNPDGIGPNYLIQEAGYQLPGWWGNELTANYVESIAAGYDSSLSAWVAWMRSPSHRTHLLASDPFYTDQVHYGIGVIESSNSKYGHYYVVLTAPIEEIGQ